MPKVIKPLWTTPDKVSGKLFHGDVNAVLAALPEQSVHTVITSPPYWGLRDYGTGTWEGGDPKCSHIKRRSRNDASDGSGAEKGSAREGRTPSGIIKFSSLCEKCGAKRIDMQIGSEPSPDCGTQGQAQCGRCFVCSMVRVFRGVRKVLRDEGTVWLNLGDNYASSPAGNKLPTNLVKFGGNRPENAKMRDENSRVTDRSKGSGLASGNLVGIPWRVALALQADGWILRQDIIWAKPAPMPESVRNRCTKAHEYIFLLAKKPGYFYDAEGIREPHKEPWRSTGELEGNGTKGRTAIENGANQGFGLKSDGGMVGLYNPNGANKRSVWRIAGASYKGAHFATFPEKLITPCVLAGTSAKGCCAECGAPWKKVVEEEKLTKDRPNDYVKYADTSHEKKNRTPGKTPQGGWDKFRERDRESRKGVNRCSNSIAGVSVETVGWEPTCGCGTDEVVPRTVLDPFVGSGTTGLAAARNGRRCWGIDLSEEYLRKHAVVRWCGVAYYWNKMDSRNEG